MGRIVVLTNPLDARERREAEHTGPLIDWLAREYPGGFHGPHQAALNLQPLAVEDYDRAIGPDDLVSIMILPAVPAAVFPAAWGIWAGVAAAAVNAAIAVGLNYAISALFGPKAAAPKAPAAVASTPAAGSVYSLSTPTNVARIGQPIPVCYGKNLVVPDQATAPYAYFGGNQQYVCQILCLGQGEFDIHQVNIANSNVAELAAGIVEYWVYGPADHGQEFGHIQAALDIYENCYTSPEVSDQELFAASGGVYSSSGNLWNGCFVDCRNGDHEYGVFWLDTPATEYAEAIREGRPVWAKITNGGCNNGAYKQVGFIVNSGNEGGNTESWIYHKGHLVDGTLWACNSNATISLTYTPPNAEEEGGPVGPFAASPPCMLTEFLQYDLTFPQGCYAIDSGSGALLPWTVSVQFWATPIDNFGAAVGAALVTTWTGTMASNTPQRLTINHAVPKGRYRVSAQRISAKSDRAQDQSACYWTGLKSVLGPYCDSTEPVYGDVTLLVVRIRATEGLSSAAHSRVSVSCTRKLNGVATRSPTAAFRDILRNSIYGGRRPASEIDEDSLALVDSETPDCVFDAIFDQRSTIWEALGLSVQMIRGMPVTEGAVIGITRDKPQCAPVAAFSHDNVSNLSVSFLFDEVGGYDGVEGEYIDPLDGSKQYVTWPLTAANPESMTLWGCTSMARAQCFVRQFWLQKSLRRRLTTFEAELDPHVLAVGDPINITAPEFGPEPVFHVVSAIRPRGEFAATVEAYVYEPGVFA